jgi:anaerobic ribonucleoside-triphosphate reductase activating protein
MNYHDIKKDDMLNGYGLRVTLFVSGCNHKCEGCQNPQTWNCNSGVVFDLEAREEIFAELDKDYISGITFSGGDPLHENNIADVKELILTIRNRYKSKDIWLYTGYRYNDLICLYPEKYEVVKLCDVLVDGEFIKELSDVNYHWAGSINQWVIDVKKTIVNKGNPVLLEKDN